MESCNSWPVFQNQCSSGWTQPGNCINSSYNSHVLLPPSSSSVSCGPLQGHVPWPPHSFAHLQQFPPPPLLPPKDAQQFWSLPTSEGSYSLGNSLKTVHQNSFPSQYRGEKNTFRNSFENSHGLDNRPFYNSSFALSTLEDDDEEEEKTQREKNQEFLNKFLEKRCQKYNLCETSASQGKDNISRVQVKLKDCLHLTNELKAIRNNLCNSLNLDESMWNTLSSQADEIKKCLESSLMDLNCVDLQNLKVYVQKRHKKRKRLRRQKLLQIEERHEKDQQTKRLHEKIDAWQQEIRRSHLATEMEKKLKKEADSILSEVRRKCSEANRMLDLVNSVSKLRTLKKQAAANKGLFTTSESDEMFASNIFDFKKLLTARLAEYAEEERTLQVMLDEEHQVTRESAIKIHQQEQKNKLKMAKQQKTFWLFGPEATINDMDPQYLYREYYTRPERNLDYLVQARQSWDIWLVPPATQESSGIPLTWVVPVKPSSNVWASYLGEHLP